jgi:hypothetical protein
LDEVAAKPGFNASSTIQNAAGDGDNALIAQIHFLQPGGLLNLGRK